MANKLHHVRITEITYSVSSLTLCPTGLIATALHYLCRDLYNDWRAQAKGSHCLREHDKFLEASGRAFHLIFSTSRTFENHSNRHGSVHLELDKIRSIYNSCYSDTKTTTASSLFASFVLTIVPHVKLRLILVEYLRVAV